MCLCTISCLVSISTHFLCLNIRSICNGSQEQLAVSIKFQENKRIKGKNEKVFEEGRRR